MTVLWQVISNGQPVGTYPEADLMRWSFEGRVRPQDLFWRPGMSAALPAHLVPPFAAVFDAMPASARQADRALHRVLPIGRSGWAIAAGYLGVLSLLLLPAPFAVIIGVLAISDIQRHQGRHGMGRAVFAVAAGSVGSVLLALLLAARLH